MSNSTHSSVLYLSHGGGPLPLLGDPAHQNMLRVIQELTPLLIKPTAIVVISAHWEENIPTISSGASPSLIYDYYGFPPEAYAIEYPALGSPTLANTIFQLLNLAGITTKLDATRGFDHGMFVPLKLMYPNADIPCVQLSLVNTLTPDEHIRIGAALAGLKRDKVLIIGSGFSFHNLHEFFTPPTEASRALNKAFEQWLIDTCSNQAYTENERQQRLHDWENAPGAKYCHPRAEHLLPLHVCYGAAGSPAKTVFNFEIMDKTVSSYLW